jgi:hypothetical protein
LFSSASSPTPWPLYQQDDLLRLDGLVDEIEALGPKYRLHAVLLRNALKKKDQAEAAVAGELIQVLDKLERGLL